MSSVVYVDSTQVTVEVLTATTVTVDVTYSSTEVEISNLQGPQGTSGVVSVASPITFNQLTGQIGINATSSDTASYVVQRDANHCTLCWCNDRGLLFFLYWRGGIKRIMFTNFKG